MIRTVEALNFRCLRYVRQDLDRFHVLVGANASGKTTFFDAIRFLGQLVSDGLDAAIAERTENLKDLVWRREGERFELAVEAKIPEAFRQALEHPMFTRCRYEVAVGSHPETQENAILAERVLLLAESREGVRMDQARLDFPQSWTPPRTILLPTPSKGVRTVVHKKPGGNDNFYDERGKGWDAAFRLGPRKSALANLPEDESKFPASTWLKRILMEGVQNLVLNSVLMRRPSPPGRRPGFQTDGSNLPWVVADLAKKAPDRKRDWVAHLRTALADLDDVDTVERPEDRHRYLVVRYRGGLEVPSWVLSDGTLRLLALTLLAYLPDLQGIFLIEEPENGIHPRAVETAFQSLSSVYQAQILLATHSPVIVGLAEPDQVLCFAKTEEGTTDIVRGSEHPALREWQRETNLGVLYAAGVLG
ncbi:MAG: ATP-binding protein [Clostridia bacterium]|nr:ATP-binding protein [Clostridia bacterium]